MACSVHPDLNKGRPLTWRDAISYLRGAARVALLRTGSLPFTELARVSAIDVRALPRQQAFAASDGQSIAYRTYESMSGVSLILIHGAACFGDQFHRMARRIAAEGLATVHTLDMRGHGASGPPPVFTDRLAMDIGEFADVLRKTRRPEAIAIAGHSAGGGLVLNALRSPYLTGVSGCLLLAPLIANIGPTLRPFFGGWLLSVKRFRLGLVLLANAMGIRRFNLAPMARFDPEACLHDPRYAREWSFATIFGFSPGPVDVPKIEGMPVLLLAGTADACFKAEHYAGELKKIAPQGEVRLLPGLGHWDVLTDTGALDAVTVWLHTHFSSAARIERQREAG